MGRRRRRSPPAVDAATGRRGARRFGRPVARRGEPGRGGAPRRRRLARSPWIDRTWGRRAQRLAIRHDRRDSGTEHQPGDPTPPATPAPTPTAGPTPTATPTIGACAPADLVGQDHHVGRSRGLADRRRRGDQHRLCRLHAGEARAAPAHRWCGPGPDRRHDARRRVASSTSRPGDGSRRWSRSSNYCGAAPVPPVQGRVRLARRHPVRRCPADADRRDSPALQRPRPAGRHRDAAMGALMRGLRLVLVASLLVAAAPSAQVASAAGPTLAQLIGQKLVVRMEGTTPSARPARPDPARGDRWRRSCSARTSRRGPR